MAFTVEDGSGIPGANAYVDEAFADGHHADRGNTFWSTLSSPDKQAAIIRATDYIDKRFGRRFRGFREQKDQGLEWPRLDAFDDDGFLLSGGADIPAQLQKATAEYALRAAIYMTLAPDPLRPVPKQDMTQNPPTQDTSVVTGEVRRKRERVGPIEEETSYVTAAETAAKSVAAGARSVQSGLVNDFQIPEYPEADMWIEELIHPSSNPALLSRGS